MKVAIRPWPCVAVVCMLSGAAHAARPRPDPADSVSEGRLVTQRGGARIDVPLQHTDVKITVDGFLAEATVTQRFKNPYSSKIEAVYLFPLPTGAAVSALQIYATNLQGVVFRFARRTGKLAWARALDATTAPWITDNELFVTCQVGRHEQQIVVAADTGKLLRAHDRSSGRHAGDVPGGAGALGDGGKQVWAFEGSRPVVDRGVRYVAMGGEIRASDAATGELLWQRRYAGASADRRSVGSVALAGSEVVIATRDGELFGLDVDTGYTLWSYAIGHRVIAEPVIARGWVYASTEDGYVVALQVGDRTLDGWHMFGGNPRHDGPVAPTAPARGA